MSRDIKIQLQGIAWDQAPGWLLRAAREANGGKVPNGFWIDPKYRGSGLRIVVDGEARVIQVD